jgi:putative hydrolase of the HAD superfamily
MKKMGATYWASEEGAKVMKYQAVVFDLFGTLVDNFSIRESQRALSQMAAILSAPSQDFTSLWTIDTWHMRAAGAFKTIEESIEHICHLLGLCPDKKQVKRASQIWFSFTLHTLTPRPDAIATLSRLKQAGYRIGMISDCSTEVQLRWQETAFAQIIDTSILSCAVGLKKPDPRIYRLACQLLEVIPQDCLYVGDGSSCELTGAAHVGMHPVLIRTRGEDSGDELRPEAEEWQGMSISALEEVLQVVGSQS